MQCWAALQLQCQSRHGWGTWHTFIIASYHTFNFPNKVSNYYLCTVTLTHCQAGSSRGDKIGSTAHDTLIHSLINLWNCCYSISGWVSSSGNINSTLLPLIHEVITHGNDSEGGRLSRYNQCQWNWLDLDHRRFHCRGGREGGREGGYEYLQVIHTNWGFEQSSDCMWAFPYYSGTWAKAVCIIVVSLFTNLLTSDLHCGGFGKWQFVLNPSLQSTSKKIYTI